MMLLRYVLLLCISFSSLAVASNEVIVGQSKIEKMKHILKSKKVVAAIGASVLLIAGGSRLAWLLCNRRQPLDVEKIAEDIFADLAGNAAVLYEYGMRRYSGSVCLQYDFKEVRTYGPPYAVDTINMYAKNSSDDRIQFSLYSAPELKNGNFVSTAGSVVEQIKKKYERDFDIITRSNIYYY